MPLRLGAAIFMAAVCATLGLMIARAVLDPPDIPDIAGREAFLLRHLLLGLLAAAILQLIFLLRGVPDYVGGLAWGVGGFVTAGLLPWLTLAQALPGPPSLEDGIFLLLWLFTAGASAWGLWLLWLGHGPWHGWRRLGGAILLLLPVLLAPATPWQEQATLPGLGDPLAGTLSVPGPAELGETGPQIALGLALGLNLLFWLLLGIFSVLAARRVVLARP